MIKQLSSFALFSCISFGAFAQEILEVPIVNENYDVINSDAQELISVLQNYSGNMDELVNFPSDNDEFYYDWQSQLTEIGAIEHPYIYQVDEFDISWSLLPDINFILLAPVSDSVCEFVDRIVNMDDFDSEDMMVEYLISEDIEEGCVRVTVNDGSVNNYFHRF